jgi:hypothetical protein
MNRRIIALAALLAMWPLGASAQVVVQAPPIVIIGPAPRPQPLWWRMRARWYRWRYAPPPVVVVTPGCCPTCCAPQAAAPAPLPPLPPLPPPPPPAPIYEPLPPPPPPAPPPRPVYAAPTPVVAMSVPPAEAPLPHWGLGIRGGLTSLGGEQYGAIGGHLRYRPTNHISLDLGVERMQLRKGESDRIDVPVTIGAQFYFLHDTFAPYLLVDIGANFASQNGGGLSDKANQVVGHIGGGLELRLARNFTVSGDVRYVARERLNDSSNTPVLMNGTAASSSATTIGNEHGVEFRLAATLYF